MKTKIKRWFLELGLRMSYDKKTKSYNWDNITFPATLKMSNIKVKGNAIMNAWDVTGEVQRINTVSLESIDQSGCVCKKIVQDLHRHNDSKQQPKVYNHKEGQPIIKVGLEDKDGKERIEGTTNKKA